MLLRLIVLLMFVVLGLDPAQAARRVALVIGNNAYANLPAERQLKKAVNDARAMRDVLRDTLGFEVIYGENTDWEQMNNLTAQWEATVGNGDIVFLYFSGHGVSIGAENFLLPSDIPLPKQGQEARLMGNSFGAEQLTRKLTAKGAQAVFTVLDACRDNPFIDQGGKSIGGPGGFTHIDAANGVFMLFAAGLGQTALDRLSDDDPDPNSIFTRSLIPLLKQGGLSQVDLAKQVQAKVTKLAATIGHTQKPAYYDQIDGLVALNEGAGATADPVLESRARSISAGLLCLVCQNQSIDDSDAPVARDLRILIREQLQHNRSDAEVVDFVVARYGDFVLLKPPELKPAACTETLVHVRSVETCLKPKETFTDCDGCPAMVVVPAGSFMMGSPKGEKERFDDEGPQHKVTISRAFAAGKFEVTFADWDYCRSDGGCDAALPEPDDRSWGRGSRPVINVSWNHAQAYVKWLSGKTGADYRLLSESEWEYAARAGTTTAFSTGATITADQANFDGAFSYNGSAKGQYRRKTTEVGSFAANDFGLYDMHGNVWEWTEDCYEDSYRGAPDDGTARKDQSDCYRVFRGGSWNYGPAYLRSSSRYGFAPSDSYDYLGFRVARKL